jgi:DNA-directed RNA polymerase specialized sigma24 family protein
LSAFQDAHMDAILRYRGMGLTQRETAKLLGCCADTVGAALRRYRAMGLEV